MRRFGIVFLSVVLAFLAVGCRVGVDVLIDVTEDGSGTVTVNVSLDEAAAAAAGDLASLRTQDMVDAGWSVEEPRPNAEGVVVLQASREFGSPGDLVTVLHEVGGVDGVFRDVELQIDDTFGGADYRFSARVELTGDPAQFSDAMVTEVLGGLPLGRTPEELAALGADDTESFTLGVEVLLPGDEPDTDGDVTDSAPWAARWEFAAGGGEPTSAEITSFSEVTEPTRRLLLVGGGVAIAAGVIAGIAALVLRRG